jgi:WD40 repeat protein
VFSADGQWISFTYEDHVLAQFAQATTTNDINLRNVGVAVRVGPVQVKKDHPRNHDAAFFSVVVTRTTAHPQPGSDDILKACEEGWVGTDGYRRLDGTRQNRALAFQGTVVTDRGAPIAEVFVVDLPDDITIPGDGPLAGTEFRLPFPPRGTVQRRLTHTANRPFPGLQGPRHWLRSLPDGSQIAFLMKDHSGIIQVWTVSPNGGPPVPITHNPWSVASAFTWSPDGRRLAYIMDNSVFVTETATGTSIRLTSRCPTETAPRPEACVFSPDGTKIAYIRPVRHGHAWFNQVFVVFMKTPPAPD